MNDSDQGAPSHEDAPSRSRRTLLFAAAGLVLLMILLVVMVGVWLIPKGTVPATRLVYEIDGPASAEDVVAALQQRLRGMNDARANVQAVDARQVEVLVASRDPATLEHAKHLIESAGILRFLIVANPVDHASLLERAAEQAGSDSPEARSREVQGPRGTTVGRWATVSRSNDQNTRPLRVDVSGLTVRRADTGEIVSPPAQISEQDAKVQIAMWMDEEEIPALDALMAVDPDLDVGGSDLRFVAARLDMDGNPAVSFEMTDKGSARFFALTTTNAPVGSRVRQLGIVLDDVLLTAPVIRSPISGQGQISGGFTHEEVDLIVNVLQAGQLPAKLREVPGSETPVEMEAGLADLFR